MQSYSLDEKGEKIAAQQAKKGTNYTCFECKKILRLRGGEYKRLHFYHLSPNPSCRQNGKSETHLAIQYHLHTLFTPHKLLIERAFNEINRIADCVWEERKIIFEIQCSPITAQEIKERNVDYNSLGYQVIWILHDKRYNRFRQTAAERYLRKYQHYYTDMNAEGKGIFYRKKHTRSKHLINLRTESFEPLPMPKHPILSWFLELVKRLQASLHIHTL